MPFSQIAAIIRSMGAEPNPPATTAQHRPGRRAAVTLVLLTVGLAAAVIIVAALFPEMADLCGRYETLPCGP